MVRRRCIGSSKATPCWIILIAGSAGSRGPSTPWASLGCYEIMTPAQNRVLGRFAYGIFAEQRCVDATNTRHSALDARRTFAATPRALIRKKSHCTAAAAERTLHDAAKLGDASHQWFAFIDGSACPLALRLRHVAIVSSVAHAFTQVVGELRHLLGGSPAQGVRLFDEALASFLPARGC